MAENREAVLSQKVALRNTASKPGSRKHTCVLFGRHLEELGPGCPMGSRAGGEACLCSRSCLQRAPFLKFEVRNLNTFHLESWFYSIELIN